eukprot:jgi/Chrzof1/6123/Cz17g10180.t1
MLVAVVFAILAVPELCRQPLQYTSAAMIWAQSYVMLKLDYNWLVSYILRCSCHEGQPSRIRDLLHHAVVVALYPIKHKTQILIQPK